MITWPSYAYLCTSFFIQQGDIITIDTTHITKTYLSLVTICKYTNKKKLIRQILVTIGKKATGRDFLLQVYDVERYVDFFGKLFYKLSCSSLCYINKANIHVI